MTDARIIPDLLTAEELAEIRRYTYLAPRTPSKVIVRLLAHIAAQEAVIQGLREQVMAAFNAIEVVGRAPRPGTKAWHAYWEKHAALASPAARTEGAGDDDTR